MPIETARMMRTIARWEVRNLLTMEAMTPLGPAFAASFIVIHLQGDSLISLKA